MKSSCKHHPEYDPASGEPTGKCYVDEDEVMHSGHDDMRKESWIFPCPWCLQARVKWLVADNQQVVEQMAKVQAVTAPLAGRIAELEKQLAEAQRLYKGAVSINADRLEQMLNNDTHKREVVLVEALEEIEHEADSSTKYLNASVLVRRLERILKKARAALEVK